MSVIKSNFLIRLSHWEYWPFHFVYGPIYLAWIFICLRCRSFFFFAAANPSIKNGGFLMETKQEIYPLLPKEYTPITIFFKAHTNIHIVLKEIVANNLSYPLIVKPNIGMKGMAVIKVNNEIELEKAVLNFIVDFIIQPFVDLPNEMGLFYIKYPNKKTGKITGIVNKEFLKVTGNGINSIAELLQQNKRYILQIEALQKIIPEQMNDILKDGEERILVPYGNHARGSLFLDRTNWVDEKLENVIEKVCSKIEGFYYGRLDIRYNSIEELKENKNWSIIELNGAGSEPTHIYDPNHSIFFAWKEIIKHWWILATISIQNKKKGYTYLGFNEGVQMFKQNNAYINKLKQMI